MVLHCVYCLCLGLGLSGCRAVRGGAITLCARVCRFRRFVAHWAKLNFGDSVHHCQKCSSFQAFCLLPGVPDGCTCKEQLFFVIVTYIVLD